MNDTPSRHQTAVLLSLPGLMDPRRQGEGQWFKESSSHPECTGIRSTVTGNGHQGAELPLELRRHEGSQSPCRNKNGDRSAGRLHPHVAATATDRHGESVKDPCQCLDKGAADKSQANGKCPPRHDRHRGDEGAGVGSLVFTRTVPGVHV